MTQFFERKALFRMLGCKGISAQSEFEHFIVRSVILSFAIIILLTGLHGFGYGHSH